MRQWLKIPNSVFQMVIDNLPNPRKGALNKYNILFPSYISPSNNYLLKKFSQYVKKPNLKLSESPESSENKTPYETTQDLEDMPIFGFISKMVPIHLKNITDEIIPKEKDVNDIKYMAFARNYCGTIKKGEEYFVIGPKHDPKSNYYDIKKYKFDNLYLFMGSSLEPVNEVPPGNIFSVSGLENYVFKTATISSEFESPSVKPTNQDTNSIIKVCIVTEELKEMPILIEGLKKLNRSDPAVEYYVQQNGEHILVTSGEVHLERCIKDLDDHLAKVKFKISAPMVNFKEGLVNNGYNFKKKKEIQEKKIDGKKIEEKERKKDLNLGYILDEGEENIDITDQGEVLKSCTPMILTEKPKLKKPEKVNNKIVDLKNKSEKTNFFIQKNLKSQIITSNTYITSGSNVNVNAEVKNKGFAEDHTPNKQCHFCISAVGMSEDQIDFLEKNEELMKEVVKRDFVLTEQLYENFLIFKQGLLDLFENKKLKFLIEKNLFCFGLNSYGKNMLIIKNIKTENCYFCKVKKENYENTEEKDEENCGNFNVNNLTNNFAGKFIFQLFLFYLFSKFFFNYYFFLYLFS